jgi:predicted heme/steroid binding protein
MNKQLAVGTALVALIIGGFFLTAVGRVANTPAPAEEPVVSDAMPTSGATDQAPVIPVVAPSTGDDTRKGGYDDDEYEDEDEYEDDDGATTQAPAPTPTPVPAPVPAPKPAPPPAPVTTTTSGYTLVDVATRNSAASCWMVIRGKVYDVTKYISKHPGGNNILKGCGKDATSLFEGVSGHLKQATLNLLPGYYKGDLAS